MTTTLKMTEKKARDMYPSAPAEWKAVLEESFGGKEFFNRNIIDRIGSYEDACEYVGIDPVDSLPFKNPLNNRQEAANAFHMLDVITEALLEGKELDWMDGNTKKWFPYFSNYNPSSGFSFHGAYCAYWGTNFGGGARLMVDTQEKAKYLGTKFIDIWNKYLNPKKSKNVQQNQDGCSSIQGKKN